MWCEADLDIGTVEVAYGFHGDSLHLGGVDLDDRTEWSVANDNREERGPGKSGKDIRDGRFLVDRHDVLLHMYTDSRSSAPTVRHDVGQSVRPLHRHLVMPSHLEVYDE